MLHAPFPDVSRVRSRQLGPSIGAMFLVAGVVLASTAVVLPSNQACGVGPLPGTPAAFALVCLIAGAGVALMTVTLKATAVSPALALGAGTLLLGGAVGASASLLSGSCSQVVSPFLGSVLVVQAGVALAVICVSGWLLQLGGEVAPWGGSVGVLAAAGAAVTTLAAGAGVVVLTTGIGLASLVLAGSVVLPWSMIVGGTGWLRRPPALALVAGVGIQALWLLVRFG